MNSKLFQPYILKQLFLFLLFSIGLLVSCNDLEELPSQEIAQFKENFKQEAEKRGFDLSDELDDITFVYEDLPGLKIGKSTEYWYGWVISFNKDAWISGLNERGRYALFLHEVGHAILDRGHKNDKFRTEECQSIMRGENHDCICDIHSSVWFDYYIDELFDSLSNAPEWSDSEIKFANEKVVIDEDDSIINIQGYDREVWGIQENLNVAAHQNFIIEVTYPNWELQNPIFYWKGMSVDYDKKSSSILIKSEVSKTNRLIDYLGKKEVTPQGNFNKLKLIRSNEMLYWYFNGILVHQMNYDLNDVLPDGTRIYSDYHQIYLPLSLKKEGMRLKVSLF